MGATPGISLAEKVGLRPIGLSAVRILLELTRDKPLSQEATPEEVEEFLRTKWISFGGGFPDAKSFETLALCDALEKIGEEFGNDQLYQYNSSQGWPPFIDLLMELFPEISGVKIEDRKNLAISQGSQFTLFGYRLAFDSLDRKVLGRSPTYLGLISALNLIPPDPFVYITTETLEDTIKQVGPRNIAFLYLNDTFRNPDGVVVPEEERLQILEILHKYGVMALDDRAYDLLGFTDEPAPKSYKQLEQEEFPNNYQYVTQVMTFSKIYGGALRLAVVVGDEAIIKRFVGVTAGALLMPTVHGQMLAYDRLKEGGINGFWDHVNNIRALYADRAATLEGAIHTQLNGVLDTTIAKGGLFDWATLTNPELNATDLRNLGVNIANHYGSLPKEIRKHTPDPIRSKVVFVPGGECGPGNESSMRLNFSSPSFEEIPIGVERLGYNIQLLTDIKEGKLKVPEQYVNGLIPL